MNEMTFEEKCAIIEENANKSKQLDKDALSFLNENAIILNDYWKKGVICKHCGKTYFLDMYKSGQLHLGKMFRNFYNHMIKVHSYEDKSWCGLMKFRIKEANWKANSIDFSEGDH